MSDWAPTIITMKIDPEKIRDVIGKGGAVIRAITEETGATVDIDNDGTVKIASVNAAQGREDFLVAPCNEVAVAWIDRWPKWPGWRVA